MKIDLSDLEGKYLVVVNTNISSAGRDYGYVTIRQNTNAPIYNDGTGRFVYFSGTDITDTTPLDYKSGVLEGGKIYYLHLGYRKDSSGDAGEDQIVINSIKVYGTKVINYNFVSNEKGGYESSNQGQSNTTSNSYIPIDLTGLTGRYNLTVNAQASIQDGDYAYATVTTTTERVSYNVDTGSAVRFIFIDGIIEPNTTATDYTTVLEGGSMYYLHLGYYKDEKIYSKEDKFTINSVKISLNDSGLYHTEIETDEKGEAIKTIPYGKYSLTEIESPEGYETIEQPITIAFRQEGSTVVENNNSVEVTVGENGEFLVENKEKAKIIVHHYLKTETGEYTTTKIAEDDYMEGKIGETYTTVPHLDLEKYQLIKDREGNYIIPDGSNTYYASATATGTYTSGTQEVIYYYEVKDIPLIVHHYIEGTGNKVPLADGSLAEDETDSGKEGDSYTTNALTEEELNEKYELVETPENWEGTYVGNAIEVTYYYKVKTVEITTRVEGEGGSITGEGKTPYETVEYGEDSIKDIIITPEEGYRISKITVNGEEIEFVTKEDGTVQLDKFIDMKEDKEVVVSFEKIPAQVIIHHYIYNKETGEYTEEKVPSKEGGVVEDETRIGVVGDMYASKVSDKIQVNYEYVSSTNNTSGEMTKEPIEVIYYYQIKNGKITENTIDKTGTEKITKEDQEVSYKISYKSTIEEYIGDAEVTIVDKLPFEITEETKLKIEEMGGVYNELEKTITWTEKVENIDTYTNGAKEINISKNITVVYVNIDYSKTSFENIAQGSIKLEETNQEENTPEAKVTTETEFTKEVEITKEWNHTNNIYGIPTEVKVQVKNESNVVAEKVLNSSNKTEENENVWTWIFTDLPKYNAQGEEIQYTVEEVGVNAGDLDYYKKEIVENTEISDEGVLKVTIINTYNGPVISTNKEMTTQNNLSYVVEGEKITYTIKVQNSGDLAGDVVVKDSIPEGTSFVAGSIKVNGVADASKTETDLEDGIRVTVPAKTDENTLGETTISFEVTVNELEGEAFTKDIKNIATINKNLNNPESPDEPTNEVTTVVNKSDLKYNKSANPESGSTVKVGDEITYTIHLDNSKGTAPTSTIVKDTIPTGTTFVKDSIVVGGQAQVGKTADDLANGIQVDLAAGESKDVVFKVTVNDLNNGDTIRNMATIKENPDNPAGPEEPTNETEHTYAEAIITAHKEMTTENNLSYVIEGEKITYTIRVQNSGDLTGDVVVKDSIPEGTSFVAGSIKVNGVADETKTETDLKDGMRVTVPARTNADTPGEATISFTVKVNAVGAEETSKTIRNTGYINKTPDIPGNPEEPTNEVVVPVLMYKKKAEIIRTQGKEQVPEGSVTAGDRIKYTITIHNVGTEKIEGVEIKDSVPEGTTIYQIQDEGEISLNAGNIIKWNVAEIAGGEVKEVSFEVTVNYDNEEKTIQNVATVDGKETNEVETPYVVPALELESSIVKEGAEKVTSAEEKVSYTIKYTANIQDFVGKATVKIVDYLPYTIDTANSELDGGIYNEEVKTITWEANIGNIDTYSNAEGIQAVEITKNVLLQYNYPDAKNLSGKVDNTAEGTITLTQIKKPEGTEQTVKEETVEDKHEVKVEIPAEVIVRHYIYDEAKGGETTQRVPSKEGGVVADEKIEGIIGQNYDTNPSQKVDENYKCINVTPEKAEGNMTKEPIEVTYYYELKTVELGATIEKTATASKQEEVQYETGEYNQEGNPITATKLVEVLTEEDGVVTYKIKYRAGIKNYKGTAKISIVDKLPAGLKEEDARVNLAGGTYNSADRTITWEQEVEVNTFETGSMYDETIEKEIKVVYEGQNVVATLVNEVTGTITIYYPENHSTNPGGERDTNTVTDTAEVEQEYKVAKQVEKVWDDNENIKGKRPESVTVQLTANGSTNYNGEELEKVVLNEENNWKYTFINLPKYTEFGQEIQYSVVETETNAGDLEYYEEPAITVANEKILITNSYKLMETDLESSIEKTGTEKITDSKEPVNYHISYKASITDYIGEVVVKVVDTLPYKLATNEAGELLEEIDLAGGTYQEETNTITWKEKIEHVNTYTEGDYTVNIQKEITLVYSNLDAIQRTMTNQVTGTVDLYETGTTNTVEDTHDTSIEIPGKVIVKYVEKETGKEITYLEEQEGQEPVEKTYGYEIEGFVGDAYTTEQKEIPGYTYVENSGNTQGNMIQDSIEVTYYYERTTAGGVIVHYEDEEGNKLLEDEIIGGKVGDSYITEQKEIENYEYVRVEGQPQGELTQEVIELTYIYRRIPAKVIVRHLEKDNTEDNSDNKELYPQEVIEGHVGDSYITSRKTITNYRKAEPEPSNKEGKMTKDDIYVIYYYEKIPSGTVTVKYVDIETKEEILYKEEETGEYKTYREQMKGYVGENYQTEAKQIPYYNLVETLIPTNKEGKYTQEDIEVTYYYRKQEFNMTIDKNIKQIEKDGKQEEKIEEKLDKIEIVGSKIGKTSLKITYGIEVSNTGEIEGTAVVLENIPSHFQVEEGTASEWKQNKEGNLEAEVTLKPGETKELIVVLSWIPGDNHFGTKQNTAEIIKTDNPAKYEETTTQDNKSQAEIVITIKTGETTRRVVFILAVTGMIVAVAIFWYLTEKYNRDQKSK